MKEEQQVPPGILYMKSHTGHEIFEGQRHARAFFHKFIEGAPLWAYKDKEKYRKHGWMKTEHLVNQWLSSYKAKQ